MKPTALGVYLRYLREQRGLSLREVGKLASIDHAYIHRLERGEKHRPPQETLDRLSRVLKPSARDKEILEIAAELPEADSRLAELVIQDQQITADEFRYGASIVYRGRTRPEPAMIIERVRRILRDEEDG